MNSARRAVTLQDEEGCHADEVGAENPDEHVELPGDLLLRLTCLRANGLDLRVRPIELVASVSNVCGDPVQLPLGPGGRGVHLATEGANRLLGSCGRGVDLAAEGAQRLLGSGRCFFNPAAESIKHRFGLGQGLGRRCIGLASEGANGRLRPGGGSLQLVTEYSECPFGPVELSSEPVQPSLGLGREHVDRNPEPIELSVQLTGERLVDGGTSRNDFGARGAGSRLR